MENKELLELSKKEKLLEVARKCSCPCHIGKCLGHIIINCCDAFYLITEDLEANNI